MAARTLGNTPGGGPRGVDAAPDARQPGSAQSPSNPAANPGGDDEIEFGRGARATPAATVGNAPPDLLRRVGEQVQAKFLAESSGHDWHHINRVRKLALQIAAQENADLEVVELAALLHDIADWKFHGGDDAIGPREAERLLTQERATPEVIAQVVDIVRTISYKGAGVATPMNSLAGRCVQDADRLDAIGAIGIARCFAYGGHAGRPLYDPEIAPVLHASADEYKASKGHSLNHFYEKLFLLKDRMNTATGQRLAQERHRYMEAFVARFLLEWDASAQPASEVPNGER